jgi:hypothetical protein
MATFVIADVNASEVPEGPPGTAVTEVPLVIAACATWLKAVVVHGPSVGGGAAVPRSTKVTAALAIPTQPRPTANNSRERGLDIGFLPDAHAQTTTHLMAAPASSRPDHRRETPAPKIIGEDTPACA